jgi:hypothetical protein
MVNEMVKKTGGWRLATLLKKCFNGVLISD